MFGVIYQKAVNYHLHRRKNVKCSTHRWMRQHVFRQLSAVQSVPFVLSPSMAALSHTKPASTQTSRDNCRVQ
jgi:hypothetical protein